MAISFSSYAIHFFVKNAQNLKVALLTQII